MGASAVMPTKLQSSSQPRITSVAQPPAETGTNEKEEEDWVEDYFDT